jgi:hypothetical protein
MDTEDDGAKLEPPSPSRETEDYGAKLEPPSPELESEDLLTAELEPPTPGPDLVSLILREMVNGLTIDQDTRARVESAPTWRLVESVVPRQGLISMLLEQFHLHQWHKTCRAN